MRKGHWRAGKLLVVLLFVCSGSVVVSGTAPAGAAGVPRAFA
jgi:hypothetical protein